METIKEVWPVPFTLFREEGSLDLDAVAPLVDFYIQEGVAGLFALGASGEVHFLQEEERFSMAKAMVRSVQGRCRLAVSGIFGHLLSHQVQGLMALRDLGVDIPVILLSSLPSSENLGEQLLEIASLTEGPLGIYESFGEKHRLLSSEDTARIACTGRFVFMKETSRDLSMYKSKIDAAEGTPFKIYQANLERLPASLELGGPGFCGIVANIWPSLVIRCCNDLQPQVRDEAYTTLMQYQQILRNHPYPASGKYLLQLRGVPIQSTTRATRSASFNERDRAELKRFHEQSNA